MMAKRRRKRPAKGISRRSFLQYSAATGVMLGTSQLVGCGSDDGGGGGGSGNGMEQRTYVFNFSHFDTDGYDLTLVAGKKRALLQPTTAAVIDKVREDHPILTLVPDEHLTHYVELEMPSEAVQLCWVQRKPEGQVGGSWDMALLFYHYPTSALMEAQRRRVRRAAPDHPPLPRKWFRYGLTAAQRAQFDDPVGEETLTDCYNQATTMCANYPELVAGPK